MEDKNKFDFSAFSTLGYMMTDVLEKTSAEKASENLNAQAYIAGLERGLQSDCGTENMAKVACQAVGREAMMDFIPGIFLSH